MAGDWLHVMGSIQSRLPPPVALTLGCTRTSRREQRCESPTVEQQWVVGPPDATYANGVARFFASACDGVDTLGPSC